MEIIAEACVGGWCGKLELKIVYNYKCYRTFREVAQKCVPP